MIDQQYKKLVTTQIDALSLHDALPIWERLQKVLAAAGYGSRRACEEIIRRGRVKVNGKKAELGLRIDPATAVLHRSEEHTSELQSRGQLVCRLLLEKKNT